MYACMHGMFCVMCMRGMVCVICMHVCMVDNVTCECLGIHLFMHVSRCVHMGVCVYACIYVPWACVCICACDRVV